MAIERILKGIRLVLDPEVSEISEEAAQEVALALLANALHDVKNASSQAWMVECVKEATRLTFVFTPLPGQLISAQDIDSLARALCAQPYASEVTRLF